MFDPGSASADALPPLPRPPTRGDRLAHFGRTGWRPFAGWVCGLILLIQGAGLPVAARVFGFPPPELNWRDLTLFVSTILGLGVVRGFEKCLGASS